MAKLIIPDKICPHCGGNEWCTNISKTTGNTTYTCNVKRKEAARKRNEKNPEAAKKIAKRWRLKHKEQIKQKNATRDYHYSCETKDIPEKICPHCHNTRWVLLTNTKTGTISYRCAKKEIEKSRIQYYKNRELHLANGRQWAFENHDRVIENRRKWYKKNKDRIHNYYKTYRRKRRRKVMMRKFNQKRVIEMTDSYIIWAIITTAKATGITITKDQITQADIDLQRDALIAKRKIKAYKQSLINTQKL